MIDQHAIELSLEISRLLDPELDVRTRRYWAATEPAALA